MSTADKLTYLNDTKDLLKNRLNSLGAEITSSTTFRNYLTWLDIFYEEVSDKTDISQNGIVGRTSQESTTGENLLPTDLIIEQTSNGVTLTPLENGQFKLNGTASSLTDFWIQSYNYNATTEILKSGVTYYEKIFFDGTHTRGVFSSLWNGSNYEFQTSETDNYNGYAFTPSTDIVQKGFKITIPSGGQYTNCIIGAEIAKTNPTNWEEYTNGPSPNPDYPQPINNLSGDVAYKVSGKNLFNYAKYITQFNETTTTVYGVYRWLKLGTFKPNTTYYISGYGTSDKSGTTSSLNSAVTGGTTLKTLRMASAWNSAGTFTTTDTGEVWLAVTNDGTVTGTEEQKWLQNMLNFKDCQIEEGSTATSYEPYIEPQTFNIPLKSKNLWDNSQVTDTIIMKNQNNGFRITRTSGSNMSPTYNIKLKANTTYTISCSRIEGTTTDQTVYCKWTCFDGTVLWSPSISNTSQTINVGNSDIIQIMFYIQNTQQVDTYVEISDLMISESGGDYEPYYDMELCKIGDYEDVIKKSTGKNLFDKDNVQLKKTANFNGTDGNEFTITNSNTRTFAIVEVPSNTNVTISTGNNTYSTSRYYIACLKSPTIEAGKTSNNWITNNGTILTTSNTKYLGIVIDSRINGTAQTSTLELINDMNIQLEESSTPTDYEPYGKGKCYIRKQIGKVVLDGSESWGLWSTNVFYIPKISEIRKSVSNYYIFGETKETAGSLKNGEYCWSNAANGYTTLFKNTDIETPADFKTWLSTHNTTVYYVLAAPTTEITQENYPALYNALKQIQDYLTAYKINKEFILGYSSPEIEY